MKKLLVFIFSIVLSGGCGSESSETVQDNKYEVLIENSCGFDKDVINKKVYAFASDIDADNALEKIMKLTGVNYGDEYTKIRVKCRRMYICFDNAKTDCMLGRESVWTRCQ